MRILAIFAASSARCRCTAANLSPKSLMDFPDDEHRVNEIGGCGLNLKAAGNSAMFGSGLDIALLFRRHHIACLKCARRVGMMRPQPTNDARELA